MSVSVSVLKCTSVKIVQLFSGRYFVYMFMKMFYAICDSALLIS